MSNVSEWSTSAGSNNDAPPDGAPEGMLPGKVNDVIRENMAALAKWYQDQNASLTTAGTTTAYTLATNSSYAALSDIPLLVFKLHAANTGSCTLNVDGLGAKTLRKDGFETSFSSGDLAIGQTVVAAYNATNDDFDVIGPAQAPEAVTAEIAAGTPMLFGQTAAPTGWTKLVTHNNKALRLVSGTASSGGTTSFTSVFASRTITQANLPSYNLSTGSLTGSIGSSITNGTSVVRNLGTSSHQQGPGGSFDHATDNFDEDTLSLADTSVSFGGSIPSGGSGTAVDFAVQYVDVIMATKDA
jgi:hypothetical protein